MKKNVLCFALSVLMLTVFMTSCDNKMPEGTITPAVTPTAATTQAPSTSKETPTPADSTIPSVTSEKGTIKSVECSRNNDVITLNAVTEGLEGTELGVVVLTEEKYADNWRENPNAVINVEQISVDKDGKGSVSVSVPEAVEKCVVCIFYDGGNYICNVGGNS